MPLYQRRFSCVCASNQNRSMAAHNAMIESGFENVWSYGTGSSVKLPGSAADKPNIYPFRTPYSQMYDELKSDNEARYIQNGVLRMLERNRKVKMGPERWQENFLPFDFVITFEERVFDAVLDDFATNRDPLTFEPVYIINLEIKDTHQEAASGATLAVQLAELLDAAEDVHNEIDGILEIFGEQTGQQLLYLPQFY
uniref:RNA polymerase II subunit A C-terminal domain phosphatase SSU72 n=1 Tax=Timspurckia oligopyrenoides TaxID=708627 RepID=A0A7S1ESX4_9RHOD|mmetsp:Transcript_4906/g.8539  ORF Transcript_4906/g.8539 Transcript_4906/m.8539 type:complete len:197 (+) Transcript_4906:41-631(+)